MVPSASGSETTRPKKQRKTGRNARVAVDPASEAEQPQAGASESGQEVVNNKAALMDLHENGELSATRLEQETWTEPALPPPRSSVTDYKKNPFRQTVYVSSMLPLGKKPTSRQFRAVGLTPPSALAAAKRKGPDMVAQTTQTEPAENGDERPKTATPSIEEPGQSDSTPAEVLATEIPTEPPGAEERETRSTRSKSKTGGDNLAAEELAAAAVNGHGPPTTIPSVPTSRPRDKISEAVEVAIAQAEGRNNLVVARGLRKIWDATGTNPYLLTVLDGVLRKDPDANQRSAFQTVMRDISKSVKAEGQPREEPVPMARTQSQETTSSLSTAKSLDPETFAAPPAAPGTATPNPPAKGKAAKAAAPKGKGKGRAAPSSSSAESAFPSMDASVLRKRAMEEDPEFTDEALDRKRKALKQTFDDATVELSNVRPIPTTPPPVISEPVSPRTLECRKRTREAEEAGVELGFDASSSMPDGPAPKKARPMTVYVYSFFPFIYYFSTNS